MTEPEPTRECAHCGDLVVGVFPPGAARVCPTCGEPLPDPRERRTSERDLTVPFRRHRPRAAD